MNHFKMKNNDKFAILLKKKNWIFFAHIFECKKRYFYFFNWIVEYFKIISFENNEKKRFN